jgi:hypothetical protein
MDASDAGGAVAHQDGDAQDNGVFFVVSKDFALGHEFGLPVEVGGGRHVSGAIRAVAQTIKDHVCRDVNEAGSKMGAELGEVTGQIDVDFTGELGLGVDGLGVGKGGAVNDNVWPELKDAFAEGFKGRGI